MKYTFKTKLSNQDCKDRLSEAMKDTSDNCGLIKYFSKYYKPTIGKANNRNNRFWIHSQRFGRDSWARIFHGKFSLEESNTVIQGKFRVNMLTILFTAVWESGVLSISALGIISGQYQLILVTLVMTIFTMLIVFAGVKTSKQKTLDFIIKTFEAEPVK